MRHDDANQKRIPSGAEASNPTVNRSEGDRNGDGGGALEQFIEEFHAYESRSQLFEQCRDEEGFVWWDLVRYSVQFALCAERGIYAFRRPEKKSLPAKAHSFLMQCALLVKDAAKISRLRGAGVQRIYVYGRKCRHLLDEIERSPSACFVVNDTGTAPQAHIAISKRSVDFFIRLASKAVGVPDTVVTDCTRVADEIRSQFGTAVDVRAIILKKYRQHRAARLAWSLVLSRLASTRLVGFVGDDTLKTLVDLANRRNIRTREFQHGYMGRSHINYSYPELAVPVQTLPGEVVVHRDSGDITYPVAVLRANGGVAAGRLEPAGPRDIDVLIGGSPTRAPEMMCIIDALAGKGLALAVKLHPIQSEASSGVREKFARAEVRIYSNESEFVALARRAKVYVPANPSSTTVFEAVESGAKLIVVDYGGVKMSSMQDAIVSGRVGSFHDLYQAVLPHLDQRSERAALC